MKQAKFASDRQKPPFMMEVLQEPVKERPFVPEICFPLILMENQVGLCTSPLFPPPASLDGIQPKQPHLHAIKSHALSLALGHLCPAVPCHHAELHGQGFTEPGSQTD